jgi:hypothetical protein
MEKASLVNKIGYIIAALWVVIVSGVIGFQLHVPKQEAAIGSVERGSEYQATSTSYLSTLVPLVVNGPASLGSVVVTGANTGKMDIYDATTTNKNLRTGQVSTSSIYRGSIPASLAAGTYAFDMNLANGLLIDISGTAPTSTITYRAF